MSVLAIDGPAGAGKSTIARRVAERLGRRYVDTGAMYRAVALAALRRRVPLDDAQGIADVANSVRVSLDNGRVLLDDEDVTRAIREDDVTRAVSVVSAYPQVRAALVPKQRASANGTDIVMDGRDIGSVVFPDAEIKVWLTASPRERATRRLLQLGREVTPGALEEMEKEIAERDRRDASREVSPMRRPDDATEIDSTDKGIEEVTEEIVRLVGERDG